MGRFLLFALLATAVSLFAQQTLPAATPSTSDQQTQNFGIPPAPKPGHPLDPNDVAILTGKSGSTRQMSSYPTPQTYYTAPVGGSLFTQSEAGRAFQSRPSVYVSYGPGWHAQGGSWGWGPYYGGYTNALSITGSQFANVTTEIRPPFALRPGSAPILLFGGGKPGLFGHHRLRPNIWFGPGAHFKHPIGPVFSPGRQP